MKKILSFAMIVLLLLCMAAFAEGIDYESMSDEELMAVINTARNELLKREAEIDGDILVFEQDGVSLYFTKQNEFSGASGKIVKIGAILINDTDATINVLYKEGAINGWSLSGNGFSNIAPHTKSAGGVMFNIPNGEIEDIEDIEEVSAIWSVYEAGADVLFTTERITTLFME